MAFCAVFLAVNLTLVLNSILEIGPVIFLRWTEWYHGELDGFIVPSGRLQDSGHTYETFLNYSKIEGLYKDTYNLSPVKVVVSSTIAELQSGFYD